MTVADVVGTEPAALRFRDKFLPSTVFDIDGCQHQKWLFGSSNNSFMYDSQVKTMELVQTRHGRIDPKY